ncbi:MAG: hypothetical protein U0836_00580 [Pirellulales bacterium]
MIVVSDTSPLRYLVLIEAEGILPAMFRRILVPPAVIEELRHSSAPVAVAAWAASPPAWLEIQAPADLATTTALGRGEIQAIAFALETPTNALLVDDHKARRAAAVRGIVTIGTVTILEHAALKNLLSLSEAFRRLRRTNFRCTDRLLAAALERDEASKRSSG